MLPPFNWQVSVQRRAWLLLIAAVAVMSVCTSGLTLLLKALIAGLPLLFCAFHWRETGPAKITWREGFLWLDDRAFEVVTVAKAHWPCWRLALRDAIAGEMEYLLLWPDSLAAEELRQLRVAIATHSV